MPGCHLDGLTMTAARLPAHPSVAIWSASAVREARAGSSPGTPADVVEAGGKHCSRGRPTSRRRRIREYRIDELARLAGTTTRNIRVYRDRGLLHPPLRVGRIALFNDTT